MILRVLDIDGEREVRLERRVSTLGSGEACHVRIRAKGVAEIHAIIVLTAEGYRIQPAGEKPVIRVGGKQTGAHYLGSGNEVQLGEATIVVGDDALAVEDQVETGEVPHRGDHAQLDALVHQLQAFCSSVLADEPWPRPAEVLLDSMIQVTGAEHGFLVLCEGPRTHVVAAQPPIPELDRQAEMISDSVVQQALRTRQPVLLHDAAHDPVYRGAPSVVRLRLSSVICLPLLVGEDLRGALYLGHSRRAGVFDDLLAGTMRVFCAHAVLLLENARYISELRLRIEDLSHRLDQSVHQQIIAESPEMERVMQTLVRAAGTELTVLLTGETGTGKEVAAQTLHRRSRRADRPFVAVDCGAIPSELLESELFGSVRGAFTGADRDRQGVVEAADGGTLFLDEIGEIPPPMQSKLLRLLETRTFRRVGDNRERRVDIRILAATNRDLGAQDGSFRRDLYFRLAQLVVELPPLRDRQGDLELLVAYFLKRYSAEFRRGPLRLGADARDCIRRHAWPGNIRELKNRLQRGALLAAGGEITVSDLGLDDLAQMPETLAQARDRFVRERVRQAVFRAGGNRAQAAKDLDIGLRSLYRYLRPPQ